METKTFLLIVCSMITSSVLFGVGIVTILATPALNAHAAYFIPLAVILSFTLAPPVAYVVARRMRIQSWGRKAWQKGDFISG